MANETRKLMFIVEDDETWAATLASKLGKFYAISHFATGEETIEKLNELKPNFIILDHDLAGTMNGLDTLKQIRSIAPDIYVIMFSGQDDTKVAIEILENGAYDYVVKGDNAFNRLKIIIRNIEAQESLRDKVFLFQNLKRERLLLASALIGLFLISFLLYLNTCPYGRPFLKWDPFNIAQKNECVKAAQPIPDQEQR